MTIRWLLGEMETWTLETWTKPMLKTWTKPMLKTEREAPKTDAGSVAERVNDVCDDALAGRLSKPQRAAVRGAVDRAERITPSSDAAVGKAIG